MSEAVELVQALKNAYEQALDIIDGGARTPSPPDRVVPAVIELEAERDQLRAELADLEQRYTDLYIAGMGIEGQLHDLRAQARYLRAAAHLFPHVNTDRTTTTEIGLPDDGDVWCLGCTVGAILDDLFGDELMAGDESEWDDRARRWMAEYEQAEADRLDALEAVDRNGDTDG